MHESGLENKGGKTLFSPPYFQGGVAAKLTGWLILSSIHLRKGPDHD